MDERSRAAIRDVKARITAMLEERQRLQGQDDAVASPSSYWSDFCAYFDYLLYLPEESFERLRVHTYHLTSDNYQIYYFDKGAAQFEADWRKLVRDIPERYVLREPEGGIGFRYEDGLLISKDVYKFQQTVNTFLRYGIFDRLRQAGTRRKFIFEIGAGYGGLAHHLMNLVDNATTVIIDLPETLLFSAAYLSLLNPHKRLYLYGPEDFAGAVTPEVAAGYDFILLPNYQLDALRDFRFDLAISVTSLQEMRTAQAEEYLDFVARTCTGTFYSWNMDRQDKNRELTHLSDLLAARFDLQEILGSGLTLEAMPLKDRLRRGLRQTVKTAALSTGLLERPAGESSGTAIREYLCRPRATPGS